MIIHLNNVGQTGNKLLSLASIIAIGEKYDDRVFCLTRDPSLKREFDLTPIKSARNFRVVFRYFKPLDILAKLILKFGGYKHGKKYNPNLPKWVPQIFVEWVGFKEDDAVAEYAESIRSCLAFRVNREAEIESEMSQLKAHSGKQLVAVHIRRGDYKYFQDGKYFFSDQQYVEWMLELKQSFPNVFFCIFATDELDLNLFYQNHLPFRVMKGTAVDDLCAMSKCDYIMGPPSTFSWWAAYYGNKPRMILENSVTCIHPGDFINFCSRYSN